MAGPGLRGLRSARGAMSGCLRIFSSRTFAPMLTAGPSKTPILTERNTVNIPEGRDEGREGEMLILYGAVVGYRTRRSTSHPVLAIARRPSMCQYRTIRLRNALGEVFPTSTLVLHRR